MASELVIPRLQKAIHALEQLLDIISLLDRDDLGALDARRAVPNLVNPHRQIVDDAMKSLAAWVNSVSTSAPPPPAPAPPSGGRISGNDESVRLEPYTQSWPTRSMQADRADRPERSERQERDDRREK